MCQTRVVSFLESAGDRADSGLGSPLVNAVEAACSPYSVFAELLEGWTDRDFALAEVFTL
jgi:hypothetical protein